MLTWLATNALEAFGLASGLLCVWLLIRQNVWTFPIGAAYSVATVWVMTDARLFGDVLLNAYYVPINLYGWWYWLARKPATQAALPVTFTPQRFRFPLLVVSVVGIALMGLLLEDWLKSDLPYWDATTTVLSFVAMWMSARKYIESWVLWLVVDVISVVLYLVKGLPLYAILFAVYLGMAVWGWLSWRASMQGPIALESRA